MLSMKRQHPLDLAHRGGPGLWVSQVAEDCRHTHALVLVIHVKKKRDRKKQIFGRWSYLQHYLFHLVTGCDTTSVLVGSKIINWRVYCMSKNSILYHVLPVLGLVVELRHLAVSCMVADSNQMSTWPHRRCSPKARRNLARFPFLKMPSDYSSNVRMIKPKFGWVQK